jgi:hypothetical protein
MKLHFDANQDYQLDAVKAVTDLFEGQPLSSGDFELAMQTGALFPKVGLGTNYPYRKSSFGKMYRLFSIKTRSTLRLKCRA